MDAMRMSYRWGRHGGSGDHCAGGAEAIQDHVHLGCERGDQAHVDQPTNAKHAAGQEPQDSLKEESNRRVGQNRTETKMTELK